MVVTGIKYVLVVIGRTLTKGSYDYMGGDQDFGNWSKPTVVI